MKNVELKHLKKLYDFVRREIAYYEATGDLRPGELTVDDVVDATVLSAYDQSLNKRPTSEDIDSWLIKLAAKHIESEIERLTVERERIVHIEEGIPEPPPTEAVSTLGDEVLDFFQPDEDLKIEDMIPDLEVPLPEEVAEHRELQRHVTRALALLPRAWRTAFVLYHVEGRSFAEIAKAASITEDEAKRYLQYASEYLRQIFLESGLKFRKRGEAESPRKVETKTAR